MAKTEETIEALKALGFDGMSASVVAHAREELVKKMKEGIADFSFVKADGSIRYAKGTLKDVDDTIKQPKEDTGEMKENPLIQKYYDVEKNAWRSFKVQNLSEI